MGYTGLSVGKRTFWPVIKTGLVQKIKKQSRSPVTATHHHVSSHCHVVNRLILSFSPPPPPAPLFCLPYMRISYAKVKSDGKWRPFSLSPPTQPLALVAKF